MNYNQYKEQMQRSASSAEGNAEGRPYVGYLSLKDGEEAIVRVMCDDVNDLEVYPLHWTTVGDRSTWVKCARDPGEPTSKCPCCNDGVALVYRVFIKVIQYVTDEEGKVKTLAKIWDRPASFMDIIADRIADYGPLSDVVCKIKRHGTGTSTTYDLLPQAPNKYPESIYVKRENAFENFNIIGHSIREMTPAKKETNPFLKDEAEVEASFAPRQAPAAERAPAPRPQESTSEFARPRRFY